MAQGLLNQPQITGFVQQPIGQCMPKDVWCDSLLYTCPLLPLVKPPCELASGNSLAGVAHKQGLRNRR